MKTVFFFVFACLAIEIDAVVKIPIEQNLASHEMLRANKQLRKKDEKVTNFLDFSFKNDYITVQFQTGDPSVNLTMILNSGEARLWVRDEKMKQVQNLKNYARIRSHFVDFTGSYIVSGDWYSGDFKITDNISIKNQSFGIISKIYGPHFPVDGGFGLAHYVPTGYELPSLVDNMYLLSNTINLHTLFLDKHTDPKKQVKSNGLWTIGDFDYDHCDSKNNVDVVSLFPSSYNFSNLFVANLESFSYGKYKFVLNQNVYIDTATSNLILQEKIYNMVIKKINPTYNSDWQLFLVSCSKKDSFEDISISFNDKFTHVIKPQDYIVDLNLPGDQCALTIEKSNGIFTNYEEPFAFGTPFARSVCLTFDIVKNQMLISQHKN